MRGAFLSAARLIPVLCLLGLPVAVAPVRAASSSFDLAGPKLAITVTRGGVTLPLSRVPNLAEDDRIAITLETSQERGEHYRLVAAFLRGVTDRPAADWFHQGLSWKPRNATLALVVPKGAQQLAVFVMPERGGGGAAVVSAVRKQPGAFVRAVQELNQASLDRARLDAYLRELQRAEHRSPDSVAAVSPVLTRSLAVKLKAECLTQPAELQAACLTGDRETLLLADTHSSALADTLAGTPTDLAFQLSATPQAGYGSYSSYIGVVRDLFRLVGAFQSTQLQFIPALLRMEDDRVSVLLNTPVSFAKPTSVMVVALPAIEAPKPPPLRRSAPDGALCADTGLVLPVEGAPLIYATDYAHDMQLRLKRSDGTFAELPVRADASVGGFVADRAIPAGPFGATIAGQLHGGWGFASFEGPTFVLTTPGDADWKPLDRASLVVGRSNALDLQGGGAGCVVRVALRRGDGGADPLAWKQTGPSAIVATVPLESADPGPVTILVEEKRRPAPTEITLRALQQGGSVDAFELDAGDDQAVLTGTRLDQVASVTLGALGFQPGALARSGKKDRLTLQAIDPVAVRALEAGRTLGADVTFASGRHRTLSVTVAPRRASVTLVRVTARAAVHEGQLSIALPAGDVFAQDAQLSFAFHLDGAAALSGRETVEIATADGRASTILAAGKGYDLQDAKTGIVTLAPLETLGALAYGPLRFRVLRDGEASAWAPLATIVRLPEIRTAACTAGRLCKLTGNRFFLIDALGPSEEPRAAQTIPDGFVATELTTRSSAEGRVFLRLRDAPQAVASMVVR